MDHTLLRSWLGLPPGSWPPDHYTLLGLTPGRVDLATIEATVLARMELLRPHQLLHPDLVTEAMNRLAQALICLTDPVARAAHDAELGIGPGGPVYVGAENQHFDFQLLLQESNQQLATAKPQVAAPYIHAEIVSQNQLPKNSVASGFPQRLGPAFELVEPTDATVISTAEKVIEAKLLALSPHAEGAINRRSIYRRLVVMRRLLSVWRKLQPVLADPSDQFDRPTQVLLLLDAVAAVQELLRAHPDLIGNSRQPGSLVTLLLRQQHFLSTLRMLLPDQRRALAIDWRSAEQYLARESRRLRKLVRMLRPRRRYVSCRREALSWFIPSPALLVFVVAMFVIAVALWRGFVQR